VLLTGLTAAAQSDTSFKFLHAIPGDFQEFTVDNLDNVYTLNSRNQVKKWSASGDSIAIYNEVKNFGKAGFIDVSNPLKLLLYYKEFNTIVVLDRYLNIRNTIDLRRRNILQVRAIGQAYDNKIWIFDEVENKLKKIDEDGKSLLETSDLRLLLGETPSPQKIFDENKYVYLYDSAQGIYVFDYYGALKNTIRISRWQNFKVVGKYIYGSRGDSLFRYDTNTFRLDKWKLPVQLIQSISFNFSATRLYALKREGLEIYTFR
jgi:hypothetical protein